MSDFPCRCQRYRSGGAAAARQSDIAGLNLEIERLERHLYRLLANHPDDVMVINLHAIANDAGVPLDVVRHAFGRIGCTNGGTIRIEPRHSSALAAFKD